MEELEIGTPINKYETVMIFKPTLTAEELKFKINNYTRLIKAYSKPNKIACEEKGTKKLAYDLKGYSTGHYVLFYWYGTPNNVTELERLMRIDDDILKFITVKYDRTNEEEFDKAIASAKSEQPDDGKITTLGEVDMFDLIFGS